MDRFDHSTARDESGRFLPGQSGNPAGKRPGTKNRATLIAESLAEGEAEALLRLVVEKALAGDGVAARFLLGRIHAKPHGRTIRLALPKGARPCDVVAAFNATLSAMAAGEITPEEALVITRVLEGRVRALKAWQTERKLTRYGETIPGDAMFEGMAASPSPSSACGGGPSTIAQEGGGYRHATAVDDSALHTQPPPCPPPLSRKPQASAVAAGEAKLRREQAGEGKGLTGEGRVRAGAERTEPSDSAAVAPIPSPRPSPGGRGSDGSESGRGSNGGHLHFACKAPSVSLAALRTGLGSLASGAVVSG